MKGCEVYFSATFSWTSPLSDRKVPIDLYGEAPPPVGVPITGLRVGNLSFPVDGRSIRENKCIL